MNIAWLLTWALAICASTVKAQVDLLAGSPKTSAKDNGPLPYATMAGKYVLGIVLARGRREVVCKRLLVQNWSFPRVTR